MGGPEPTPSGLPSPLWSRDLPFFSGTSRHWYFFCPCLLCRRSERKGHGLALDAISRNGSLVLVTPIAPISLIEFVPPCFSQATPNVPFSRARSYLPLPFQSPCPLSLLLGLSRKAYLTISPLRLLLPRSPSTPISRFPEQETFFHAGSRQGNRAVVALSSPRCF